MRDQAIRALYSDVVSIVGDKIMDKDENIVSIDESAVTTKMAELQTAYDNLQYQRNRKTEYPSIEDQLDDLYHNGIDGWKTTIKAIKDKYPKS